MKNVTLTVDEAVFDKARQYAAERGTTLEALLVEHLAVLAGRAGRRLTLREQTYADCAPSKEVLETLRAEGLDSKPGVR